MKDFISEHDLENFDVWLKYQGVEATSLTAGDLVTWRGLFDDVRARAAAIPKVGLMKLRPISGEYRYAVAVREGADLWLTLWVKRSKKGEFFVMIPRGDGESDPHTSYHLDGTLHMKSYGMVGISKKRQPLTGAFRGNEGLGVYAGHGPKGVGAICNPLDFSGIVEVGPGVLGPREGTVVVDLVEPDCEPMDCFNEVVQQQVFRDVVPWVVIRICSRPRDPSR